MDKDILAQHAHHSPTDQEQVTREERRSCFYCLEGCVFLGSLDHDGEEVVESVTCRRCGGTGNLSEGRNMTRTTATAFGRVLTELLEKRGLEPSPETVGDRVLRRMASRAAGYPGSLSPLAKELRLSDEEMQRLANALLWEEEE